MLTAKDFVTKPKSLEEYLTSVWCEILQLDEIDIDEDFFELGGDSVQAVKIANRLRETLKVELRASTALKSATIEGLAVYLNNTFPDEMNNFFNQ